jgi:chromosome segregation ATPase
VKKQSLKSELAACRRRVMELERAGQAIHQSLTAARELSNNYGARIGQLETLLRLAKSEREQLADHNRVLMKRCEKLEGEVARLCAEAVCSNSQQLLRATVGLFWECVHRAQYHNLQYKVTHRNFCPAQLCKSARHTLGIP